MITNHKNENNTPSLQKIYYSRQSNMELLRIVSMLLIVLSHCVYHGVYRAGKPETYSFWSSASLAYKASTSFSIMGAIGVGLFFMISGFFNAHKERVSLKRVILITLFYAWIAIIVSIIAYSVGFQLYGSNYEFVLSIIKMLFVPVSGSIWWFVTAYVLMMLFAPLYNRFLSRLNRTGILLLILFLLLFFYTLGSFGSVFHDLEKAVFFYTLGVYFRDYEGAEGKKALFLLCVIGGGILKGVCQYITYAYAISNTYDLILLKRVCSILNLLIAEPFLCFGIFGIFMGLSFQSRIVNVIARHTFGIYLFHDTPIMRELIWIHWLQPYKYYGKPVFYLHVALCVSVVFGVGLLVDLLREKTLEKPIEGIADRIILLVRHKGFKAD